MTFSEDLARRGLIKDKTFSDLTWLDEPKIFYLGVDASADSLTIGNLAAFLLARRLLDANWKAVLLVGGATSLIGDPKITEERELKPREEILKNVEAIKKQVAQLFAGEHFTPADNYEWFKDVKYLDFLREIGKSFSMTELMQREFVTERMGEGGSGISYAEFSYSLIQGYDYWQLFKNHGTVLQIGGSDQWGNMLSGVALVRKKEGKEVHALSMPLVVNKETGTKFGKSEGGAIWLDPQKTTPTQFYQFWINIDDADVENYLKVFTLLPKEQIEQVILEHKNDPGTRKAQNLLAEEVTKLVHGQDQSGSATGVTKYLTGQASIGDASDEDLAEIRKEIPHTTAGDVGSIIDALVQTELIPSNSMARTVLNNKGIYVNGQNVTRDSFEPKDFQNGRLILRRGKAYKDSALIEIE
ncbi:MAG TPA: tyrosine--tRNA ligase [Candidatus Saccharimonadales bacterium]|nr:tyrosine--tRNA ligase [Candidatus Saccharimonadales bacterium]